MAHYCTDRCFQMFRDDTTRCGDSGAVTETSDKTDTEAQDLTSQTSPGMQTGHRG